MMSSSASATPASSKITHIPVSPRQAFPARYTVAPTLSLSTIPSMKFQFSPTLWPFLLAIAVAAALAACSGQRPPPATAHTPACPPTVPCPACPVCPVPPSAGAPTPEAPPAPPLQRSAWSELAGWDDDDPAAAWPALRRSCQAIGRQPRWQAICEAAAAHGERPSRETARHFFETHFEPWRAVNADGSSEGLVTGYYEPVIRGSRTRSSAYPWPIRGVPEDMLTIDLGDVYPDLKHLRLRGRVVGNKVVPYWTRAEIDARDGDVPAATLLWAADPIDLFFLQVQGSGQVELPDGTRVRIGYADQNGHPYASIGRWLVAQGELPLERASMQGIKEWARANPARLTELLHSNPSYVFFRELPVSADGPVGALGVPLTPGRSIAIDPRFVPLGAPVFLATTYPLSERPLRRLVLAQDTGGAIKGVVRADFFWGLGEEAGTQAGRMRQQGAMWVLLPKGSTPAP